MPVKRKVTLEQVYAKLEGHDRYFEKHDRQFEGMTKLLLFRVGGFAEGGKRQSDGSGPKA